MHEYENFERGSPTHAFTRIYLDFSLQAAVWTRVSEVGVNVAGCNNDFQLHSLQLAGLLVSYFA